MREAEEKELEYLPESIYDSRLFSLTFYFIQTKNDLYSEALQFKVFQQIIAVPPQGWLRRMWQKNKQDFRSSNVLFSYLYAFCGYGEGLEIKHPRKALTTSRCRVVSGRNCKGHACGSGEELCAFVTIALLWQWSKTGLVELYEFAINEGSNMSKPDDKRNL